jgi:hypothetical protein
MVISRGESCHFWTFFEKNSKDDSMLTWNHQSSLQFKMTKQIHLI